MLVVADSSPLVVLIQIGHIAVLPTLFGQVVIPQEVSAELHHSNRPQAVHEFIASRPAWLLERAPAALLRNPIGRQEKYDSRSESSAGTARAPVWGRVEGGLQN